MSSGQNSPPLPSPAATDRRRASITGQGFHDFFGRAGSMSAGGPATTPGPYPGPITAAALNAQRRRLSLTTVGLSGSPNQTSPFHMTAARPRNDSLSSANSGSVDENPFEDEPGPSVSASSNPTTPFGRRLSFGARAMQNVRTPGALGNNNGEGYNFAENLRTRAERASISGAHPMHSMQHAQQQQREQHQRARSVTVMEPPAKEIPKNPRVPDAFQERILKGDFYMD